MNAYKAYVQIYPRSTDGQNRPPGLMDQRQRMQDRNGARTGVGPVRVGAQ